jgi:hypothetical protein
MTAGITTHGNPSIGIPASIYHRQSAASHARAYPFYAYNPSIQIPAPAPAACTAASKLPALDTPPSP